jgi:uncharacterized membrane protein YhaH (DUF805 family)
MEQSGRGPGWFPDPQDPSLVRWWTGREWSSRTQRQGGVEAPGGPARVLPGLPPPVNPAVPRAAAGAWDAPIPIDLGGTAASAAPQAYHPAGPPQGPPRGGYGVSMSWGAAVADGFRRMFRWSGRTSRSGFWWLWLTSIAIQFGSSMYDVYVLDAYPGYEQLPYFDPSVPALVDLVSILLLPLSFGVVLAQLGAGVRRMHDIGRSGWWIFVPLYNIYLATRPSDPAPNRWG